jgi:Ca-activated chloride channel family protein
MLLARRSPVILALLSALGAAACGGLGGPPKSAAPAQQPRAYGGRVTEPMETEGVAADAPMREAAPASRAPAPAQAQPGAPAPLAKPAPEPAGTEQFQDYGVNPFVDAKQDRLSTFSIDVDTASYSIARRKLNEGTLPPFASVRAEEFLNSFDYGYQGPSGAEQAKGSPFHVDFAAAPSPFAPGRTLIRVGVQAKRVSAEDRVPVHLVYLVDVSGSMSSADRLPLAKRSLKILTDTLKPGDTVALCTYAGSVAKILDPTGIDHEDRILRAIDSLGAGGSTAMSSGIQLAYDLASKTLVKGHVNRVVVLSDGDANVGNTSHQAVLQTIARYKDQGITLSTVGFGSGNYKDTMMEQLADKGDGNYTYIDTEEHAKKVFGEEVESLLQVVARDVKIQVELDPNVVRRYRLIGYENRDIRDKDFRNDKVDAGEVGAGHSVTALYEVELADTKRSPLVVRMRQKPAKNALNGGGDRATETVTAMPASAIATSFAAAPGSFRFATAVAGFAEILRHSPAAADWKLADVERIAAASTENRPERAELVALVRKAEALSGARTAAIAR